MLSARKAGLYVCAITTRYSREELGRVEARPDLIADSFAQFREYFKLTG
jgi:phosphoglycolate phosphatase-like HAD superfamily hydrolase